uniref:Uncharacterized protein n=1 Tax=Knipowitschia caucasica TaxID=637954 RepID=A0AAV2JA00_KNICA
MLWVLAHWRISTSTPHCGSRGGPVMSLALARSPVDKLYSMRSALVRYSKSVRLDIHASTIVPSAKMNASRGQEQKRLP